MEFSDSAQGARLEAQGQTRSTGHGPVRVRGPRVLAWTAGWIAAIGVLALIGKGIVPLIDDEPPSVAVGARAALTGVRTSIVRDDRVWLRVSADEVTVGRPRIVGPFRIGFLRTVSARNVTVEAFDRGDADRGIRPEAADMSHALTRLLPTRLRKGVVGAELDKVKVIQHRGGQPVLTVEAERCRVGVAGTVVCANGQIDDQGSRRFAEASYDGHSWTVTPDRDPHH